MTNEELIDRLFYFSLKHEEMDMSFFNTRIGMLDEYPSIVFHPMQLYGVRDVFYISHYPAIKVVENKKYNDLKINYDLFDVKGFDVKLKDFYKKKLKLNYAPNFNKITNFVINSEKFSIENDVKISTSIESEKYGLSTIYHFGNSENFIFLDKNDAIKYKNSLTKK